jgi:hypothetical protein
MTADRSPPASPWNLSSAKSSASTNTSITRTRLLSSRKYRGTRAIASIAHDPPPQRSASFHPPQIVRESHQAQRLHTARVNRLGSDSAEPKALGKAVRRTTLPDDTRRAIAITAMFGRITSAKKCQAVREDEHLLRLPACRSAWAITFGPPHCFDISMPLYGSSDFMPFITIAMSLEQGQPPIIPMPFQLSLANLGERGRGQYRIFRASRPGVEEQDRAVRIEG